MSSSSHNPAYVPGPTFGFVKLLASSGSHCTKWADEQHRPAGFESRLVPSPLIPTLIGLRAFDLVSSPVWWEAATNSVLHFPALSTVSLCLFSNLSFLLHLRSRGRSRPRSFVWVSRQNRQGDRLSGANTNRNELPHIVSQFFIDNSDWFCKLILCIHFWLGLVWFGWVLWHITQTFIKTLISEE